MIQYLMVCNKAGAVRVSRSYTTKPLPCPRYVLNQCLRKNAADDECSFIFLKDEDEARAGKVKQDPDMIIFRQYASLFFILAVTPDDNPMAHYSFIHNLVETLNSYFSNVCELDLMHSVDRAHMILDEMVVNGYVTESNRSRVLAPITVLDKALLKKA